MTQPQINVPAGRRQGTINNLRISAVAGANGNVTVAGMLATSTLIWLTDVTNEADLDIADFTPGAGVLVTTEDTSTTTLLVLWSL